MDCQVLCCQRYFSPSCRPAALLSAILAFSVLIQTLLFLPGTFKVRGSGLLTVRRGLGCLLHACMRQRMARM